MALNNVKDPADVMAVYDSIINNEFNWLLLHYATDNVDELSLLSYGPDGLEEMKTKLYDLNRVFIGFYREEVDEEPGYLLIIYIPPSVSGVKRARALVHARRVGVLFNKHQTMLTVDNPSQLTVTTIYQALAEPDNASISMGRSFSQSAAKLEKPLPNIMMRAASEATPETTAHCTTMTTKSYSMFSNILRRKKRTEESVNQSSALPPPPPPKDKDSSPTRARHRQGTSQDSYLPQNSYLFSSRDAVPTLYRQRSYSVSEFAVISHAHGSEEVFELGSIPQPSRKDHYSEIMYSLPLRGKWALTESSVIMDPAERTRRRIVAQKQRDMEEKEATRQEEERQAAIKREKDLFLKQEEEAEMQRRCSVEEEIKRITAERRRKEQLENEEEQRRQWESEERKRLDRKRRIEEHRRLEEWRREQVRMAEETALREEMSKKQEEEERKRKILLEEVKVKKSAKTGQEESFLSGWVTVQSDQSLSWKRRYYKFTKDTVQFYRSPNDTQQPLDALELRGLLRALREWNEGYEYLEAIPFSFAIEFKDGRGHWSMFADSEEDKFKILGLLHHAAGL